MAQLARARMRTKIGLLEEAFAGPPTGGFDDHLDMTRFPTAGHLCSWAKFSPAVKSSAGKNKGNGSTGHG